MHDPIVDMEKSAWDVLSKRWLVYDMSRIHLFGILWDIVKMHGEQYLLCISNGHWFLCGCFKYDLYLNY
jgi:hypothetical protein